MPGVEWRLLFALCRFGGFRCPSEIVNFRWVDIDWGRERFTVYSPKTERHPNGKHRNVPLFPDLVPYLGDAFESADPGAEYVITRYRHANQNLRTQLQRIIKKAGLQPWPKLFQNLRSTRQTELQEEWPTHVVCAWIGNSAPVAQEHYLQVTDDHFERAAAGTTAVQNPVQHPAASPRSGSQPGGGESESHADYGSVRSGAAPCDRTESHELGPAGLEPPAVTGCNDKRLQESSGAGAAESGALGSKRGAPDPDLQLVVDAWATLPEPVKAGILAMVRASAGHGGGPSETEESSSGVRAQGGTS